VHALLIACVHRVAHHLDAADLKWLYDIHLLASRFDAEQWGRFVTETHSRRVTAVCRRGLQLAVARFGTAVPDRVLQADLGEPDHAQEPSAAYLTPTSHLTRALHDARYLSWSQRLALARAHLFPSREYMRQTYARDSRAPVAVLYLLRALRGAGGWVTRR
jgi:hypothetical protein